MARWLSSLAPVLMKITGLQALEYDAEELNILNCGGYRRV